MYFTDWRKLQRDSEMFNISERFVCEGIKRENFEDIIHNFLSFVKKELRIKELPKIQFTDDKKFPQKMAAFGVIKKNIIIVSTLNRHIMDVLRTLAHELVHYKQHTQNIMGNGKAGDPTENEANKLAGTIVRKFGEKHSGLFALSTVNEAKKRKRRNMIDIDSEHYPIELA